MRWRERPKPTKLAPKNCQGGTKKRFVRQALPSELIQDSHFRYLWEQWWGAKREEQSCGRMFCLKDLFVLCVTYKHRAQNLEFSDLPCLLLMKAQLSHVLGSHPGFHSPEDQDAGGFSCCHCSAQIIKYTLGSGCVILGHISVSWAPLPWAVPPCPAYWDEFRCV